MTSLEPDDEEPPRPGPPPGVLHPEALSALLQELAATPRPSAAWDRPLGPGEKVGRFELGRELGRGGFGVVYEARDTGLGRQVAFKAVRPGRSELANEQLLREAEAIAQLSHPNLVTLFDVGRCEQGPYLVLELLRGVTLKERLRHGPVALAEALRIALETARGLAHAHAQGVIHRDLKPSNVFLCQGGFVKVLDFGMAHAFGRVRVSGGTPAYMAPEQVRGAPEDERTDIFALGVMIYEMLSGELPFPESGRALDTLRRPSELKVPDAPALGSLVDRMLSRDPVERPRQASEVLSALSALHQELERSRTTSQVVYLRRRRHRAVGIALLLALGIALGAGLAVLVGRRAPPSEPAPGPPVVAVLPFASLSASPDDAYFADGIHGELITQLAKMSGLRVIARSSVEPYRKGARDLKAVARALGAGTVLEGTVQRSGERVRIAAQLVDPRTGQPVWSDRFDRELADVFAIQTEVALEIAHTLGAKLTVSEKNLVSRSPTGDREAHDLYLRGLYFWERSMGVESDNRLAEELFGKAVARDPGFALAHGWLAITLAERGSCAGAREHAERALSLEPDLPQAHEALAAERWWCQRDAWSAIRELEITVRGAPGDALSRTALGSMRTLVGDEERGLADLRLALTLDPRSYYVGIELAGELAVARRFDEAAKACEGAREISPGDAHGLVTCAFIPFWRDGDLGPVRAALEALPVELPTAATGAASLFQLLALFPEKALSLLASGRIQDPFSAASPNNPFIPRAFVAGIANASLGRSGPARAAFLEAIAPLEAQARAEPSNFWHRLFLGRALVGAGRVEDGMRQAQAGLDLVQWEQQKSSALQLFAQTAVAAGRHDEALKALATVLERPIGPVTAASLRRDPRYAPLLTDPRFEALLGSRSAAR